jgi:hypothetical protein
VSPVRDEHEDEAANLQDSDEELMDISYNHDYALGNASLMNGKRITLDFGNQSMNSNRHSISNQIQSKEYGSKTDRKPAINYINNMTSNQPQHIN